MTEAKSEGQPSPLAASARRVGIVGGGLAGLAAAAALAQQGCTVELFESRDRLGGRASSFVDKTTSELVDNCQHVSMGCCTNLAQFCRQLGLGESFRKEPTLHFIAPNGCCYDFRGSSWLPAPLHLAGGLWGLKFLSMRERIGVGRAMMALARERTPSSQNMADWLAAHGQSERAREWFWGVVLVSALSESLDRISVDYARQVFVEGFMAHPQAYVMEIPSVVLGELYGQRMEQGLARLGVSLQLGQRVRRVGVGANGAGITLEFEGAEPRAFDAVVAAVPWQRAGDLFDDELRGRLPELAALDRLEPSPITSVHLWFDRLIAPLEHAVLVGRVGQWLFHRPETLLGHYYQVVISASREASQLGRENLVDTVCRELAEIWPAAREAKLLHARTVTEHAAVFAPLPGVDALRPAQRTVVPGLYLAGDWTRTGWPATMEGAVRSGVLAAQEVLRDAGRETSLLARDLQPGWLARRVAD